MTLRMRRLAVLFLCGLVTATLTGCPEDDFDPKTWTKKLGNPKDVDRAVTQLERLGEPSAIPALGKAWEKQGRPERILQVIIDLSKPLTETEAKEQYKFNGKARPASWDKSLPILVKAIEDVDPANPRSVESARLAAEALGQAKLEQALEPLVKAATGSEAKPVRGAAILSLGTLGNPQAVPTLANILREDFDPQNPAMHGAAIIALGKIKSETAIPVLVEAMYRLPFFFKQVRRSLVASGPAVSGRIKGALEGSDGDLNTLFKEKKLDLYCGDIGKEQRPISECDAVSAMDYYAAIIAGDLYDPSLVPALLKALGREQKPSYFSDERPGPPAQNGELDALRKIGSAAAAGPVLELAVNSKDPGLQSMAILVYAYVSRDGSEKAGTVSGLDAMAKMFTDPGNPRTFEAAATYARLARSADKIKSLQEQAKKYEAGSKEERAKADGAPKAALAAATIPYDAARAELKAAKDKVARAGGEKKAPVELITAMATAKTALDKVTIPYSAAKAKYDESDIKSKNFKASQREFEMYIARIEIAIRCGDNAECYAKTLTATFESVKGSLGKYVAGLDGLTEVEQKSILGAQAERAMLELGKMGDKASSQTAALLAQVSNEDPTIRQSVGLALPKVAGKGCKECGPALDAAIRAGEGNIKLKDLNYETSVLRSYWGESAADAAPAAQ